MCSLSPIPPPPLTRKHSSRWRREVRAHCEVRQQRIPLQLRPYDRRYVSVTCSQVGGLTLLPEIYECSSQIDGTNYSVCLIPRKKNCGLTHRPPARNSRHGRFRPVPHAKREIHQGKLPACHVIQYPNAPPQHSPVRPWVHARVQVSISSTSTHPVADRGLQSHPGNQFTGNRRPTATNLPPKR